MPRHDFKSKPQVLLIDADDTLWENNIYFERAIASFISFLNHREYTPEQVRAVLNQVESENIKHHGYGLHSFANALVGTFERLSVEPITPALHETIHGFAHTIAEHPMELIRGVAETLLELQQRHRLIVVTKGNYEEQTGKVKRSGLKQYFSAVEVVREKDPQTYHHLCEQYSLSCENTWMIGNSPRSDINPSLAAGLNAVFVPHDNTWILEHEDVAAPQNGQMLLTMQRFSELVQIF